MSKQINRTKPEFIEKLLENVYEMKYYHGNLGIKFDRYWWDYVNNRLIMKPKRGKQYKIVHPMFDKYHIDRFVHIIDINGKSNFANYDYLEFSHSIGFYLSIDNYDFVVSNSKNLLT